MTAPIPATSEPVTRRGRGFIIAGSVLLTLSIVGGTVVTAVIGSRLDFGNWEDVAIKGASDRLVPGAIDFEVLEPLDEGDDGTMTVGIALSSDQQPEPRCSVTDSEEGTIVLTPPRGGEELLDWDGNYSEYSLIGSTRLEPGEYRAVCDGATETAAASGVSFTVGRVLGMDEFAGDIGPIFAIFGVMGLAGLLFVVGVILLIVGLVQRSRSGRPPATGYFPGQYAGQYPPGAYPPGGYPPGAYPPGPPQPYPPQPYPPGQGWSPGQPGPQEQPPYEQAPATPPPWTGPPAGPSEDPAQADGVADRSPPQDGSVGGWTVPPSKR